MTSFAYRRVPLAPASPMATCVSGLVNGDDLLTLPTLYALEDKGAAPARVGAEAQLGLHVLALLAHGELLDQSDEHGVLDDVRPVRYVCRCRTFRPLQRQIVL